MRLKHHAQAIDFYLFNREARKNNYKSDSCIKFNAEQTTCFFVWRHYLCKKRSASQNHLLACQHLNLLHSALCNP